jgi:hypothetical protein
MKSQCMDFLSNTLNVISSFMRIVDRTWLLVFVNFDLWFTEWSDQTQTRNVSNWLLKNGLNECECNLFTNWLFSSCRFFIYKSQFGMINPSQSWLQSIVIPQMLTFFVSMFLSYQWLSLITCSAAKCWGSWFIMFFVVSVTSINHTWIWFNVDSDRCAFIFRGAIARRSNRSFCLRWLISSLSSGERRSVCTKKDCGWAWADCAGAAQVGCHWRAEVRTDARRRLGCLTMRKNGNKQSRSYTRRRWLRR